ncbi:MAG: phage tail tape measure protein [Candidatus Hydrothermae bacterium]|nr:phage tail tape measure protein [Candidatus Hydrothermae bacterium]
MSLYRVGAEVIFRETGLDVLVRAARQVRELRDTLARTNPALTKFHRQMADLRRTGKAWMETGSRMMAAAGMITAGADVMARHFHGSLLAFGRVEQKAKELQTVLAPLGGSVAKSADMAVREAWRFARSYGASAEAILEAQYRIASAGLTDPLISARAAALSFKLAKATRDSLTGAAQTLVSVANAFSDVRRITEAELVRMADVLTYTQQTFQLASLGQLAEGMKYVGGVARNLRVNLESVSVALGVLNTVGLEGSMAGTGLRNVLLNLTRASRELGIGLRFAEDGSLDLVATLRAMQGRLSGLTEVERARVLQKIFGMEGFTAAAQLLANLDRLEGHLRKIQAASGLTERSFRSMMEGVLPALREMGAAFAYVAWAVGRGVAPAMIRVARWAAAAARAFGAFLEAHRTVAALLGGVLALSALLVSVVGPVLMMAGAFTWLSGSLATVTGVIGAVGGALAAINPIILLVAAGIATLTVAWKANWLGIRDAARGGVIQLKRAFRSLMDILKRLGAVFTEHLIRPVKEALGKLRDLAGKLGFLKRIAGFLLPPGVREAVGAYQTLVRTGRQTRTVQPAPVPARRDILPSGSNRPVDLLGAILPRTPSVSPVPVAAVAPSTPQNIYHTVHYEHGAVQIRIEGVKDPESLARYLADYLEGRRKDVAAF